MTDIVERLRAQADDGDIEKNMPVTCMEAADEIERLRKSGDETAFALMEEIEALRQDVNKLDVDNAELRADNKRLENKYRRSLPYGHPDRHKEDKA